MKTKQGITLKFGDVIINHWAGPNNPNRKTMVVSVGKYINCLDKKGNSVSLCNDRQTCISILGNSFDLEKFDNLNMPYEESKKITQKWHLDNPTNY